MFMSTPEAKDMGPHDWLSQIKKKKISVDFNETSLSSLSRCSEKYEYNKSRILLGEEQQVHRCMLGRQPKVYFTGSEWHLQPQSLGSDNVCCGSSEGFKEKEQSLFNKEVFQWLFL